LTPLGSATGSSPEAVDVSPDTVTQGDPENGITPRQRQRGPV
jgi:hypothetical protein